MKLVAGQSRSASSTSGAGLTHSALFPADDAVLLADSALGDHQRVAVVLQAIGLLAHLEHSGWQLREGWRLTQVTVAGRLVAQALPGRDKTLAQVRLLRLLTRLFGEDKIAGRGRARRSLRLASARWRQSLEPIDLDRAVQNLFDHAPFLWETPYGPARSALVGMHRSEGGEALWIAGPGSVRRRLLGAASTYEALSAILAGDDARSRWIGIGEKGGDPRSLAAAGRHAAAVRVWERRPLKAVSDLEAYAASLFALGSFERALEALRGMRTVSARLARVRCLTELGERGAAEAAVGRLAGASLDGASTVVLAEIAVRLHTLAGNAPARADWVARALSAARGDWRPRALILQAMAAYDGGLPDAMDAPLAAAAKAADRPSIAWRLAHARALQALERRDGPGCVAHARHALGIARRRLPQSVAGRIWSTLVAGHGLSDDLPSAERAARHALRIFGRCDGTINATLAWHNLAEARVRRGRFEGVDEIIAIVLRENRRAGNRRGRIGTLALRMRLALGRGLLTEALQVYDDALNELGDRAADRSVLHVLAARALAWSGQRARARALLESASSALTHLEPEERPALLTLVGLGDEADRLVQGTPWMRLWRGLAAGRRPPADAWCALDLVEPYRAARLIFDCELVMPGAAPPERVVRATAVLHDCHAHAIAERLEACGHGPWTVIDRFLDALTDDPASALADTLARIGQATARVVFVRDQVDAARSVQTNVLADGDGGSARIEEKVRGGRLEAFVEIDNDPVRTLLKLFAKLWRPPASSAPRRTSVPASGIIGESAALLEALDRLERLSGVRLPLLILGESGTGKELAARFAHRSSSRSSGPFVAVNCAAVSESLLLSDLFGHVRGAFTGADRDHKGVFEAARGGTVFLDEIGDLPAGAQGMLLRVLQESEIRRVGEATSRAVDVRVVAATHRDLVTMVDAGTFRQDLYFRLKGASVQLPPLRDRGSDILELADHFLLRMGLGRLGARARERLLCHGWPGNVRELRNVLEVAAALAPGGKIEVVHLDLPATDREDVPVVDYQAEVLAYRRKLLLDALAASKGNQAEAARRLGLTRQALSYHVKKLDLYHATLFPQG